MKRILFHFIRCELRCIFPLSKICYDKLYSALLGACYLICSAMVFHQTDQLILYKNTTQILLYLIRFELKCIFPHPKICCVKIYFNPPPWRQLSHLLNCDNFANTDQKFQYEKTKHILSYLIRFELNCIFPHSRNMLS